MHAHREVWVSVRQQSHLRLKSSDPFQSGTGCNENQIFCWTFYLKSQGKLAAFLALSCTLS